ncbi:conserved hypothetical protein [Culex quinquefasciatus]|uniref:DNA topoisomerase (ATP-hydrolyzing) n=1 Tax=Culex quinquefasciatus TaxID=7176 RepID=B0XD28_CULQU|nr:conserved hypothetical protein [Culex quinquefasciatus]|eukprot:XP_001867550.1 conserved hypothetical protein [Culex quinquefasciatus]
MFRRRNPSTGGRIGCQSWLEELVTGSRRIGCQSWLEELVHRWTDWLPNLARETGPSVDGFLGNVLQEESVHRWSDCLSKLARGIGPPVDGLPVKVGKRNWSTGGQIARIAVSRYLLCYPEVNIAQPRCATESVEPSRFFRINFITVRFDGFQINGRDQHAQVLSQRRSGFVFVAAIGLDDLREGGTSDDQYSRGSSCLLDGRSRPVFIYLAAGSLQQYRLFLLLLLRFLKKEQIGLQLPLVQDLVPPRYIPRAVLPRNFCSALTCGIKSFGATPWGAAIIPSWFRFTSVPANKQQQQCHCPESTLTTGAGETDLSTSGTVYSNDIIVKQLMLKLKENMKLQVKSFCSKCVMSEKFVAAVLKRGIVELVLQWAKFKAQTELSKASGSKKSKIQSVPKLEDANDAGTKYYSEERLSTRIWICSPTRTTFERNDKREVKVTQLTGSVAEMSAYHHGEQSLCSTIVDLTQNFVSSNNINLLYPRDQFGTRLPGVKDSAKPRFILTMMSALTPWKIHCWRTSTTTIIRLIRLRSESGRSSRRNMR